MSRCPGCGRCRVCGQPPAPVVYPYPAWPNVPYVPAPLIPQAPTVTPYPYQWSNNNAAIPLAYGYTFSQNANGNYH